jgi:hypothetical protein
MDNKIILFSAIGILLFYICRELHKQETSIIQPKDIAKKNKKIEFEKDKKESNDFVFPEITTITQPLTNFVNKILDPDLKEIDGTPIKVIRNKSLENTTKEIEKNVEKITPKPSDIVSPNPIESTEYYFVGDDTSNAWSDKQISQHPSYHTSKIGEELTQTSGFFDSNNEFHDQTSPSAKTHLPDRCFQTDNHGILCKFNNRLHNIPPKLIDGNDNNLLKSIGQGEGDIFKSVSADNVKNINQKSYQVWDYENEKINNGGEFFEGVYASSNENSDFLVMDNLPKGSYSF